MEAVDVGARRLRIGRPVAAHPQVAVRRGEQGARQPAVIVPQFGLHQPPGVDGKSLAVDGDRAALQRHASVASRSSTTMSAPAWVSASRLPPRSTPTTSPKLPARPAATPELASSTTTASAGFTPRRSAAY